jgi:DNA-binding NtrC family response regulator
MPQVLIIDDEKLIRWSLKHILGEEGFEVDSAATREEAIALLRSNPYSLIIADMEACGEPEDAFFADILSGHHGAKLIVLTALSRDYVERTLGDGLAYLIMEKPFDAREIKAAAKKALGLAS